MSLVFGSREVSVGPTVGFQGDVVGSPSPSSAYVSKHQLSSTSNPISTGEEENDKQRRRISCFSVDPDLSNSSDNSAIDGFDDDDDDSDDDESRSTTEVGEDDENEVRSKFKGSLCSMESLEDSLPIKRGLSNFFSGKSKSFASLSDATTVKSLEKTENPFNKRRRTLIACKWSRRAFYSSMNPVSMPLLALNEDEEEQSDLDHEVVKNNKEDDDDDDSDNSISYISHRERKIRSFKPSRCFSLTDLQQN
ncbi:hypothetical protein BVC80_8947g26 [Macleaya cordata]|uniref:Uncharacterized protein n=1 Tax=Macleaya cordata TaxID=56857 RepID=A0A200QRH6_MACCD|nr:hypothetical protein BVC80_8947g26 [Macleaya cordata]